MVKIPKRGKPQFLKPEDVQDNDLATIIKPPFIQSADRSKYGKERTIITVTIPRIKEVRRWGLNNTSSDRLVDAYGEDGDSWKDKEVRILKRLENIRGQDRYVLYAQPSIQAEISPAEKLIGEQLMTKDEMRGWRFPNFRYVNQPSRFS